MERCRRHEYDVQKRRGLSEHRYFEDRRSSFDKEIDDIRRQLYARSLRRSRSRHRDRKHRHRSNSNRRRSQDSDRRRKEDRETQRKILEDRALERKRKIDKHESHVRQSLAEKREVVPVCESLEMIPLPAGSNCTLVDMELSPSESSDIETIEWPPQKRNRRLSHSISELSPVSSKERLELEFGVKTNTSLQQCFKVPAKDSFIQINHSLPEKSNFMCRSNSAATSSATAVVPFTETTFSKLESSPYVLPPNALLNTFSNMTLCPKTIPASKADRAGNCFQENVQEKSASKNAIRDIPLLPGPVPKISPSQCPVDLRPHRNTTIKRDIEKKIASPSVLNSIQLSSEVSNDKSAKPGSLGVPGSPGLDEKQSGQPNTMCCSPTVFAAILEAARLIDLQKERERQKEKRDKEKQLKKETKRLNGVRPKRSKPKKTELEEDNRSPPPPPPGLPPPYLMSYAFPGPAPGFMWAPPPKLRRNHSAVGVPQGSVIGPQTTATSAKGNM